MGKNVQQRGHGFQLRVIHKSLPKPFFHTFDSHEEANAYGERMLAMLDRGVVPLEFTRTAPTDVGSPSLVRLVNDYRTRAHCTTSDDELLKGMLSDLAGLTLADLTVKWAESYVATLKGPKRHLTPGSIRKRIGGLGRVVDWHLARNESKAANPLRLLPRGYSIYSADEAAAAGGERVDAERNFRLPPDDEAKLLAALNGAPGEGKERGVVAEPEVVMLAQLILDTGLRLTEAMTLRIDDQIDLAARVIQVEGTKGHRGKKKPRVVPIKRTLLDKLAPFCAGRRGLLFPGLWNGEAAYKRAAARRLSCKFTRAFEHAGLGHMTEHDLRHEATCRWFEFRRSDGRWAFSDVEVCRLMGWTSTKMALRYLSLRGEDLAARLDD